MASPSKDQAPSTFTVRVFTRHSSNCKHRDKPQWKQCDCRKSVYKYENGKVRYISARTRSWAKAEEFMRTLIDERDPVKKALREIEQKKQADEEAKEAKRIRIDAALDLWRNGQGLDPKSSLARQLQSFSNKVKNWAGEMRLEMLDQITPALLFEWRGQWSETAKKKRDRLKGATQKQYVSKLHSFFRWAKEVDYVEDDPSAAVKHRRFKGEPTQPLVFDADDNSDRQMRELLNATYRLDEDRYQGRSTDTHTYGRDLRAVFLLQRWTGIRISDALKLRHAEIRSGCLWITTKKKGKSIAGRPLPQVVLDALTEVASEPRAGLRDGYFFWMKTVDSLNNLSNHYRQKVQKLDQYLDLKNEDGQPMHFHSHMLRDTFAVDLLLHGASMEDVAEALTNSVRMVEEHYAPWTKRRREKLHDAVARIHEQQGMTFPGREAKVVSIRHSREQLHAEAMRS